MAGGRWQVAGGKWQVAGGKWQVASGRWQVQNHSIFPSSCPPVLPSSLPQQLPAAGSAIRAGTHDFDDGKRGGEKVRHFRFVQTARVRVCAIFGQFVKGVKMKMPAGCEICDNSIRIVITSIGRDGMKTAYIQNVDGVGILERQPAHIGLGKVEALLNGWGERVPALLGQEQGGEG